MNKSAALKDDRSIHIVEADLNQAAHQQAVVALVDAYSQDSMGDGKPLSEEVRKRLLSGLRGHPTTLIFVAYKGEQAVGIAVCFRGFSTFAALPLINIHDLAVLPENRGSGIGRKLLEAVERRARELGCCGLTLEVQDVNQKAKGLYESAGFSQYGSGAIFL